MLKNKFKDAINAIIDRDDITARKLIKETIQSDARYLAYKKTLKKYGFDFKTITIDEKIYEQIENILKEYDKPVQLTVLDEMYKMICQN